MHKHIKKLHHLADKPQRLIIGLMSGTSLDGLDVALCRVEGHGTATSVDVVNFETVPYTTDYRDRVRSVFSIRDVDLQTVCLLNAWIGLEHGKTVNACLKRWHVSAEDVDLVASHGQTIYHCPRHLHQQPAYPNATLQIGDGDHLAHTVGIITCSDFRQKHLAAGGEGAPLAMYGDYLVFSSADENRVMLNIGGIANLTWLPRSMNPDDVMSTDVGTGNTLMDAFVQHHYDGLLFDANSARAKEGTVSAALLAALKADTFFDRSFPKTIGPELFNLDYLRSAKANSGTEELSPEDQLATLNRFSADSIVEAILGTTRDVDTYAVYSSGGGIHNALLMENIQAQLPQVTIESSDVLGIEPDAKEAVLFAVLANECVAGEDAFELGKALSGGGAVARPVTMGKISFPD
jgi:anhydro-N-acetylmuramic acid kinase